MNTVLVRRRFFSNLLFETANQRFFKTSLTNLNTKIKEKNLLNNGFIYITDNAIKRLEKILEKNEVLRISIDSGGCKGLNYLFEVEKKINENDRIFEINESKIVIDSDSLNFIKESVLDYNDELIKSSFCIKENPQMNDSCSCGVSFSPKIFKM